MKQADVVSEKFYEIEVICLCCEKCFITFEHIDTISNLIFEVVW